MAASIPNSMIYEAQTAQTGTLAHAGDAEAVRRSARPPRDPALLRCGRLSRAGLPGPGHGRRASPRLAGPSRVLRAAAAEARHRAGQEAAGRGRPSRTGSRSASTAATPTGPWQQQVCEIFQGQLAPAGIKLNINLMPADPVLGDLGPDAVRHHRLDPSAARHHGAVGRLPHRRALERDPASPARSSTQALDAAEGAGRRRAAPGGDGEGREDPPGRGRAWCSRCGSRNSSSPRTRCSGMKAHPTQYHQFHRVWITRLTPADRRPGRRPGPLRRLRPRARCCCSSRAASPRCC